MNKLLERQVRKFLPAELLSHPGIGNFLNSISDSYNAYERDIDLSDRAFKIAEEEYKVLYSELTNEIALKRESIHDLRATVAGIGGDALTDGDDENELLAIASYLKDQISIRIETEKKLNQQKKFYEQILNEMPADIAVFDREHRYLFLNPIAIKDGALRQWMIGKTDEEYCTYRNKDASVAIGRRALFSSVVAAKTQKDWEEKLVFPDGRIEYHLRKMYPVFEENGELEIVIGYGVNITNMKKNEEQVRLSEARYRSIFDNSQALIFIHDMDGIILEANKTSFATLGYEPEDLVGRSVYSLIRPENRDEFKKNYLDVIKANGKAEGIMVARSKSGQDIYLLYQNFLVSNLNEQPYVIGFSQDITARIVAERALKKSEEKYRNIIENMNLGMVQTDDDDKIVYANNTFCAMSGYTQEEMIGVKSINLLLTGENAARMKEANIRRRKGLSDAYEIQLQNKAGENKWWMVSGAPLMDNYGQYQGSIGVNLDITSQKTMELELRKAKADAETSAHSKEIFLANMSHEIRTPMNAIIGIGRLLGKTGLQAQQKYYLDIIQNASGSLLTIINDLLDYSKIESGKVNIERVGFSITDLVDKTIKILHHKADEKNLLINSYFSLEIEPVLIGDPHRVNQVLMNLLGNSIKFTETGEINVVCDVLPAAANEQKIHFSVTDTGVGMNEDFLAHIFDKFTQEDESITRKYGGTGLGMSITKQLITLMGGNIEVETEKNVGTKISFVISFPVGSKEDLPSAWNTTIDSQVLKGKKILLVEDNYMNRVLAKTILGQYGASVTSAENGAIAIEQLDKRIFDLILMDVQMPVKNGIETTLYIRDKIDKNIPIIALTANALKKEQERCLSCGMNDYISKPFDEDELIHLIAQWMGNTNSVVQKEDKVKAKVPENLFDLSKLRITSKGDEKFVTRMVQIFSSEIPISLDQLNAALENGDLAEVAAIAHRVKPSVQSFGILSIGSELQALESIEDEQLDFDAVKEMVATINRVLTDVMAEFKKIG